MSGPWGRDGSVTKEALFDQSPIDLLDEERATLGRLSRPMLDLIIDLLERAYDLGAEEVLADEGEGKASG